MARPCHDRTRLRACRDATRGPPRLALYRRIWPINRAGGANPTLPGALAVSDRGRILSLHVRRRFRPTLPLCAAGI